jgi:hypothetical protein
MDDELVRKIYARVEQCRRLARSMTDERTVDALNKLADELEEDLKRSSDKRPTQA